MTRITILIATLTLTACGGIGVEQSVLQPASTIAVAAPAPAPTTGPTAYPTPSPALPPPSTPAAGLGGIWTTTGTDLLFTSPATDTTQWSGTIDFYYEDFSTNCNGFAGDITATGTSLAGTADQSDNACTDGWPDTFTGTIAPGQSLTLTVTDSQGAATTTTWTFDPLYLQPSSLSALAGNWTLADSTVINIDAEGNIVATSLAPYYAGCTVTGTVAIINPQFNLYSFSLAWTNCPSGPYENSQLWTGFLAVDGSELVGGGVINTGDGGAFNQAWVASAQ
jgi:hypothetical protein